MESKIFSVDEEIVNDLQLKDCKVAAMQAVLTNFLEMHLLDSNTDAIESPIIKEFQNKVLAAKIDFEKAKDAMLHKVLPDDIRERVVNWSLSYFDCELSCVIKYA